MISLDGKQNLINFVSNIATLDYLTAVKELTPDMVIGLQALSKVATRLYSVEVKIVSDKNEAKINFFDERETLISQKIELPSSARNFKITAGGQGLSIFQISYQYNVEKLANETPFRFQIDPVVLHPTINDVIKYLHVCTNYTIFGESEKSKMVKMTVRLPSGYNFTSTYDLRKELLKSTSGFKVRNLLMIILRSFSFTQK